MAKLSDYLKSLPLYPLPHHFISRMVFWATRLKTPLKNPVGNGFIKAFNVDMSQAKHPKIEDYESFNAFFTRELKDGARPIAQGEHTLACPADGCVSQSGRIQRGRVFQAKGQSFSLLELLGGDQASTDLFMEGQFATVYLSPRDYHRLHMPLDGTLKKMTYIPGRLFSVAGHTVRTVPRLFARNERVVCVFDTPAGPMALILVGAINVAAIETVWSGLVTPGRTKHIRTFDYSNVNIHLNKGDEMGRFNMGSTVIVLTGQNVQWAEEFIAEHPVQMGEAIGSFTTQA